MDGVRPAQTLVLWALRERAKANDGVAEMSLKELSRRCFVTVGTVCGALKSLEETGVIEIERQIGRWNEPQTNRYRVKDQEP